MRAELSTLDSPTRIDELTSVITRKPALRALYEEHYAFFAAGVDRCPGDGLVVELGSGGGFIKERVPGVITTDVLPYRGVDRVVDALDMPFADASVRALLLLNVFHHIPDGERFLREAERCLAPGGRILMIDQHVSWVNRPILRYLHHEPFDPTAADWRFDSAGPLSGANGAQTWIVFQRDRPRFDRLFSRLSLVRYQPHTPFRYWLSGGLKSWSLLPGWGMGPATRFENAFLRAMPDAGSFVNVEVVKR